MSWVGPATAEVLRLLQPLTVTVQPDSPLLRSSVELDMRMLCMV